MVLVRTDRSSGDESVFEETTLHTRIKADFLVYNLRSGVAENRAIAPRCVASVIRTNPHLLQAFRFEDVLAVHVAQARLIEKAGAAFPFVVFGRNQCVEGLLKFRRAGHQMPQWIFSHIVQTCIARIGPRFNLRMPDSEGIPIRIVPRRDGAVLVSIDGEPKFGIDPNLHQVRPRLVNTRNDAVHPVAVVHLGVLVVRTGFVLQLERRGIRIVGIARILAGAVSTDKPLPGLPQLQLVLVKFNVPQAEAVIALVHGGTKPAIESVYQLGALVGILGIEAPMQRRADLEVFGVVIDEVDFLVACAEEIAEATGV